MALAGKQQSGPNEESYEVGGQEKRAIIRLRDEVSTEKAGSSEKQEDGGTNKTGGERKEGRSWANVVNQGVEDEMVGQYYVPKFVGNPPAGPTTKSRGNVSIGEALEAVARCAGDQPINNANAAAIEAAEKRAIGTYPPRDWGLGAEAHNAAERNYGLPQNESMTTIDDVLEDGSEKLMRDKAVTSEEAVVIIEAEVDNDPEMATTVGGSAAAGLNRTSK